MVLYCNLLDVRFYVRSGFQELTATVMDQVVGQNVLNGYIDNVVHDADDRAEVRVVAVVSKSCPLRNLKFFLNLEVFIAFLLFLFR